MTGTAEARAITPIRHDHPRLSPSPDLSVACHYLEAYHPTGQEQWAVRDQVLRFIEEHPQDAHLRSCIPGHLTASALVVEREQGRVLLTHHRKLDRWLQLGGHCDGDANLAGVALREALEESGIEGLEVIPEVVDVDIHPIPERAGEPAHLHLDSRFLVIARQAVAPQRNHESNALRWLTPEEVRRLVDDHSVLRLLDLLDH